MLAFWLAIKLDTSVIRGCEWYLSRFYFPVVVATSITLRDLKDKIYSKFPWSNGDSVNLQYFNISEQILLPLTSEADLVMLFSLNAAKRFGRIRLHVQPKVEHMRKRVKASSGGQASYVSVVSANSVCPCSPCRSTTVPSIRTASVSQIARVADVEDEA